MSRTKKCDNRTVQLSKRPFFILLLLTSTILIGGVLLLSKKESPPLPSSYEYFSLATCPHCQNVGAFLASWDQKDKISLDKKDVSDSQNQKLMYERALYCKIPKNDVGVPFIFTPKGECIIGDVPIIDYLKNLKI